MKVLDKHFTTLHGYTLRIFEFEGKPELHAPSEARSFDGREMNWLNAALSAIRINPKLFHQTRFGTGFADQWGGCFLYSDQEAAMIQHFRKKYREAFERGRRASDFRTGKPRLSPNPCYRRDEFSHLGRGHLCCP